MLDIKFIRDNPDLIRQGANAKGFDCDVDRLLSIDAERRKALTQLNGLRQVVNKLSAEIPSLGAEQRQQAVAQVKQSKAAIEAVGEQHRALDAEYDRLMLLVPNVPLPEVPRGAGEADNVEIDRWGRLPEFAFEAKDHLTLALSLGLLDLDRSRTYAGSRSYSLIGDGVLLERAVVQLALEHVLSKGFLAIAPPVMVRESAMVGTGYFPVGSAETYSIERDELFLVGTSEVSLVAQHAEQVLEQRELPLRYVGVSPCFRREAGASGRDTRGLYRVHMFTKVEQVSIGPNDEQWSRQEHLMLLENSREILRQLEIPHRVALACTGELGLGQVWKHEIESWMPSRAAYAETHSCSSLYDFQARRSRIRVRREGGESNFAFTLNNTAIASPRILIPLLENHQNADGTVTIPAGLRRYLGGRDKLEPR